MARTHSTFRSRRSSGRKTEDARARKNQGDRSSLQKLDLSPFLKCRLYSNVVVHGEFVGVWALPQGLGFMLGLVPDPRVDHVFRENIPTK
jgi:hypothetical protein